MTINILVFQVTKNWDTSTRGGGILIWIAVQSQQTGGIQNSHVFWQVQAAADLHPPKRTDRHRRSFDG